MTTITTQRNKVITEAPEHDDVMVQAILFGEGDTPGSVCGRSLRHLPITAYQELVDWAVGIADRMAHPIYVMPLSHNDIFRTERWTPYRNFIAGMNDQERGKLRGTVVTTCCEVMRDCDDPEIRADMFHILRQLNVVRHES